MTCDCKGVLGVHVTGPDDRKWDDDGGEEPNPNRALYLSALSVEIRTKAVSATRVDSLCDGRRVNNACDTVTCSIYLAQRPGQLPHAALHRSHTDFTDSPQYP